MPNVILAARKSAIITLATDDEPFFADWAMTRSSKLFLHLFEPISAVVPLLLTENGHEIGLSRIYRRDHTCKERNECHYHPSQ